MAHPNTCQLMSGYISFDDKHELARFAAKKWLDLLAIRDSVKPFTVALSGGRIPKLLYQAITELAQPDLFENVHFFWGDERLVPPTDDESNFKLADEGLLGPLGIPNQQVHRVFTEYGESEAIQRVTAELHQFTESKEDGQPVIDLVLLGMGEDAHVASLFPGDAEALQSQAVYRVVTGPKPPARRITLGYRALTVAREVWVLASGQGKVDALRNSLLAEASTPLARVIQNRKRTEILTDFSF